MLAISDVWANALVAGGFLLGVIVGGIGVIRIYKYALEYMKGEQSRRE